MTEVSFTTAEYIAWLTGLKSRVEQARQRAVLSINWELVSLYWQIGREILERRRQGGGDQLARDLRAALPDVRGFSPRNLPEVHAHTGRSVARRGISATACCTIAVVPSGPVTGHTEGA
jgi:hypothetical protein